MVLKNADGRAFEVHCAVQLSQIQTAAYSFTETENGILAAGSGIHDACFLLRVEGTQVDPSFYGRDADLRLPFLPTLVTTRSVCTRESPTGTAQATGSISI